MVVKFKNNLYKNFPFLINAKLLVAVSGGIDSVILTHLLFELNFDISIAHVNFHLRGADSDLDEVFVMRLADTLKVPFLSTDFNTKQYANDHNLSIQEAARNLRYEWFEKIRTHNNLDYILTAHNLNDSLETFLINLSRGTGLKGFTGIPTVNKKIIRPLLDFSRDEIAVFAFTSNIQWREDKSNAETKYTRNKIRHQVIPILQELNPNLLSSFKQTLENLQSSEAIIQDRLAEVVDDVLKNKKEKRSKKKDANDVLDDNSTFPNNRLQIYNISKLQELNNVKAYLYEIFAAYGFSNMNTIYDLLSAQSGKQLFSSTHRLVKDRDVLLLEFIERKNEEIEKRKEFFINEDDSEFEIQDLKFKINSIQNSKFKIQNLETGQFDKDLLNFPLIVRKWQNGDYFYPMGMQGKKKLSKYFKDEKLSLIEKENIWLLLSDKEIVWVMGMRQDERFKITNKTTKIIKMSIL